MLVAQHQLFLLLQFCLQKCDPMLPGTIILNVEIPMSLVQHMALLLFLQVSDL